MSCTTCRCVCKDWINVARLHKHVMESQLTNKMASTFSSSCSCIINCFLPLADVKKIMADLKSSCSHSDSNFKCSSVYLESASIREWTDTTGIIDKGV